MDGAVAPALSRAGRRRHLARWPSRSSRCDRGRSGRSGRRHGRDSTADGGRAASAGAPGGRGVVAARRPRPGAADPAVPPPGGRACGSCRRPARRRRGRTRWVPPAASWPRRPASSRATGARSRPVHLSPGRSSEGSRSTWPAGLPVDAAGRAGTGGGRGARHAAGLGADLPRRCRALARRIRSTNAHGGCCGSAHCAPRSRACTRLRQTPAGRGRYARLVTAAARRCGTAAHPVTLSERSEADEGRHPQRGQEPRVPRRHHPGRRARAAPARPRGLRRARRRASAPRSPTRSTSPPAPRSSPPPTTCGPPAT